MRVSIIIPAYNAEATLRACLEACLGQDRAPAELIVVDDGSTDGTGSIAESIDGVRYVRQENAGPAAARNHGARIARGDIFAYTDADCVPRPDWIACLVSHFEEGVAAVGGAYGIANPESRLARLVHEEIVGRHRRFGNEVDFLGSFNVAYRRDAFEAAGGFDANFPLASGEDNDLAYRLQDHGGTLRFTPEAIVAHRHPERLWPYLSAQYRHGFWRMKLYAKHPRRARAGDHYARPLELMTMPAAAGLMALAPAVAVFVLFGGGGTMACAFFAICLALFVACHVLLAVQLLSHRSISDKLLFAGVSGLRSFARALGLVRGLWVFRVLKRETA